MCRHTPVSSIIHNYTTDQPYYKQNIYQKEYTDFLQIAPSMIGNYM